MCPSLRVGFNQVCMLLAMLVTAASATPKIGCESSGMCSIGSSIFFRGDISEKGVLSSALQAVSFKNEIIVSTIMGNYHMEMFLQLRQDFLDLGMAHMLALTTEKRYCHGVWDLNGSVPCVWDTSPSHRYGFKSGVLLMHLRLRFIARAARLGYNVLNLDRWMDDEFAFLKSWGVMKDREQMCQVFDGSGPASAWAQATGSSVSKLDALNNQQLAINCHQMKAEEVPPPSDWPTTVFPIRCTWWADTNESEVGGEQPQELFGFAPRWFASSAWELRHGYNTPLDGSRPRRVYNRFHWSLSAEINKAGLLPHPGPYIMGRKPPGRVLALAMLSNRTLVFPDVPCEAGWMLKDGDTSACDGSKGLQMLNRELMPYAALMFRFVSPFAFHPSCVNISGQFSAMLNVEFEQWWLRHDAPAETTKEPGPSNVAFVPADPQLINALTAPPDKLAHPEWSLGEFIVSLSPLDALKELRRFAAEPLLYVTHSVVVDFTSPLASDLSGEDRRWVENQIENFKLFTSECTVAYEHPWDYSHQYPGKPEHAVGKAGFMRDDGLHVNAGAKFPNGSNKPWVTVELEEPLSAALQNRRLKDHMS
eukprot:gene17394-23694_t